MKVDNKMFIMGKFINNKLLTTHRARKSFEKPTQLNVKKSVIDLKTAQFVDNDDIKNPILTTKRKKRVKKDKKEFIYFPYGKLKLVFVK